VAVVDISSGQEIHRFESEKKAILNWCWHPRDTLLAFSGFVDAIIWSAERGEIVHRFDAELDEAAYSIAWSADGTLVATGHWWPHGRVLIWDLASGNQVGDFLPEESRKESNTLVSWLAWGESMSVLFVGVHSQPYLAPIDYNRIEVWNPITLEYQDNLKVGGVRPSPRLSIGEKRQLLAEISGEAVAVRDFYYQELDDEFHGEILLTTPDVEPTCVAWAPGCEYLATGYSDGSVRIWA
jgi:WD40 repeat protein